MSDGQRIEIGCIDFAIQPALQTEALSIRVMNRAMTDAVHRVAGVGQCPSEVTADEAVRTCDPNCHEKRLNASNFGCKDGLYNLRRIASNGRVCCNVLRDHRARGHYCARTDSYAAHDE